MSIVEISAVSYRYATRRSADAAPALDGVDLRLEPGTLTALLGPNGSGKSTLLRLVAGLDRPRGGEVRVAGAPAGSAAAAAAMGVVFQTPSLDSRLTVRENLHAHAILHGLRSGERAASVVRALEADALGPHADRLVRTLSGGLVRRVDLARALLARPRVLLLDEPTVGLDPASRAAFLDRVTDAVTGSGLTALLTTHLVDEADRANRVVLMHRGRVVVDGAPTELRAGLGGRVLSVACEDRPAVGDPNDWRRRAGAWTVESDDDRHTQALLAELLPLRVPVTVAPPTLADLFARLTGDELDRERSSGGETTLEAA